jgi:hypothetical protein
LRFERVDNLGAYSIPSETGLLIPSVNINHYRMKAPHIFGYSVAVLASAWASYVFFRGSITGVPPMYSRGWLERILHFIAGIIFGALTVAACLKLAGRW